MALKSKLRVTNAEFYAKHIKDWQHSGLSQEKYCKSVNIAYSAFVYWRVRFLAQDKKCIHQKFISLKPLSLPVSLQHSSSIAENEKITVLNLLFLAIT